MKLLLHIVVGLLALISVPNFAISQWDWVDGSNSFDFDQVNSIAVDETREFIYAVGIINDNLAYPEITNYHDGVDGFVIKYDLDGAILWAFALGGDNDDIAVGVAVDEATGNIYVTGGVNSTFVNDGTSLSGIAGGVNGNVITAPGGLNSYVACYNGNGQLLWFKLGGGSFDDYGTDIAVNSSGVYATGVYDNNATFGSLSSSLPPNGTVNNYLIAYNAATGSEQWLAQMGSETDDANPLVMNAAQRICGVSADENNVYVINSFHGSSFNIYDASNTLTATVTDATSSSEDIVVTSFTDAGTYNWRRLYDNSLSTIQGLDITNDCDGVYIVGTLHTGSVTPGGVVVSSLNDNFFMASLNKSNGTEQWFREFFSDAANLDYFTGIDADGFGNIYATGILTGNAITIENPPVYTATAQTYPEIIVAHYKNDGDFQSFTIIAGSDDSWGTDIAAFQEKKYVLSGYYDELISFGTNVPVVENDNAFVAVFDLPPVFTYNSPNTGAAFCQSATNPLPIMGTGNPGGVFSGPPEIQFVNTTTGEIDIANCTVGGPYTINYTDGTQLCGPFTGSFDISVTFTPDPSFAYASNHLCAGVGNLTPTSIATPGGLFTAPPPVVFLNSTTGVINSSSMVLGTTYTITYKTLGFPCQDSTTFDITLHAPEDATFSYDESVYCQSQGTVLPNSIATPGGLFSAPPQVVFSDATTGEIDLVASTPGGPYSIQYSTPGTFCANTGTFNLSIEPEAPDPTFAYASSDLCVGAGNPIPVSITSPGGNFYVEPPLILIDPLTGEIDINSMVVGVTYPIKYKTTGAICVDSSFFNLTLHPLPDATFSYAAASYCSSSGTILPFSVLTPGGVFSGPPQVVFSDATTGEISLSASTPGGPYAIQYAVYGAFCSDSTTFDLTILAPDDVSSIEYADTAFCMTEVNQLPVISSGVAGFFTAAPGIDLVNSSTGEISPSTSIAGGPYIIEFTSTGSCPVTVQTAVYIDKPVTADAGVDQFLDFTFSTDLNATPATVGIGIWTTSSTGIPVNSLDPGSTVNGLSIGINSFTWTVKNGVCPAAIDEVLIIVEDIFIPQAITPNGDGDNDLFIIGNLGDAIVDIEIFNRWGQLLFEEEQYQNDWDGRNMNGDLLAEDTYYYMITINDSLNYNGFVVLKK